MELFKVMNLPDGHLLQNGKYRLTHVVGQGGFGITYRGVWYTEVKGSLGRTRFPSRKSTFGDGKGLI